MTDYLIARPTPAQLGQIPAIEEAAATIFPLGSIPENLETTSGDEGELSAAAEENRLWVIMEKGSDRPLGFVLIRHYGTILYLAEIDVLPEYGRRGLGTALLSHAIQYGRDKKFENIYLTTFATIPWNAPFYARHGFSIEDEAALPEVIRKTLATEQAAGFTDRVGMRLGL